MQTRVVRALTYSGVLALSLATLGAANAEEPTQLQQEINEVLAKTDGGVQISANEISWEGGSVIMSFPLPGETIAPPSSEAAQELQAKSANVQPSKAGRAAATAEAAAADNCPTEVFGNDWYCFYQYNNFGGRRLQWNAQHAGKFYFSKYDFVNRTSSWSNKGSLLIRVYGRTVSGKDSSCTNRLWDEPGHSHNANLGSHLDNRADCFDA